jgi:hypothetical protein
MVESGTRMRATVVSVASVLAVGLSGCMGPDLSSRADDIGGAISAVEGVEHVETSYGNDIETGRSLVYEVTMDDDASASQAVDAAGVLERETGDEFDRYSQELRLTVQDRIVTIGDETNGDIMAKKAPRLLALASSLSGSDVSWEESSDSNAFDNYLEIRDSEDGPFEAVDAVNEEFGSDDFHLHMFDHSGVEWYVAFPFSDQAQERVGSAAGPVLDTAERIDIADDQVSYFSAAVPDGPDKASRLRNIIERIDSPNDQPWDFTWAVGSDPTGPLDSSTGGIVNVGGCEYDGGGHGRKTRDAQRTQDQLRDIYDTCR